MINLQMVCELGSVFCNPDPEDMDDVGLNEGKPLVCVDSSISIQLTTHIDEIWPYLEVQ